MLSISHLRQLLCDIATHEDRLEVDPQILHLEEVLNDLVGCGEFAHPLLNTWLEGSIVPVGEQRAQRHEGVLQQGYRFYRYVTFKE